MIAYKKVLDANIKLHTILSKVYRASEPHYRPENVSRVESIIRSIKKRTNATSLLDVGCGEGFIIDIARKHFKTIRGVDITPAMIEKVNTRFNKCDIKTIISPLEHMPFKNASFPVITAYAVLHHLHALKPALQEIYRVLKPGGIFYSDTDPNFYFWEAIKNLPEKCDYSSIIERERQAVRYKDKELLQKFHVPRQVLLNAEMLKHQQGGFKEEELKTLMTNIGFSSVTIQYEWFLGEAGIIHSKTSSASQGVLRDHLRELLPLTRHLFKYISIIAVK